MNKKISLGTAITLMAIAAALSIAITMVYSIRTFNDKLHNINEREATYQKLAEINKIVRSEYYGKVDEQYLMDSIAAGYVKGIGDKYAVYLTAEEYKIQTDAFDGKTVDIGAVTQTDPSGYLVITEVYPDSPAENAGLQENDLILKIDDLDVTAETLTEAQEALKGDAGTRVTLVVRQGMEDLPPMEITRRRVEKPTVYYRVIDNIGYVQIKEFVDATPNQFTKALESVVGEGAKALIFDVRNNPGGTIDAVAEVLDKLLPEGPIVSYTNKKGETEVLKTSDANEVDMPMVVLTNERSASSAELFAQALKDYEKAKTVGVTTYGKGMMQRLYSLDDGSALDITVGKYNPPKSENFDGVGVKPDYEVKLTNDQERMFEDLDETSDPQLRKALELAKSQLSHSSTGGSRPNSGETEASEQETSSDPETEEEPESLEEDDSDETEEEESSSEDDQETEDGDEETDQEDGQGEDEDNSDESDSEEDSGEEEEDTSNRTGNTITLS